jgi:broad specificity phosphatase PhoE
VRISRSACWLLAACWALLVLNTSLNAQSNLPQVVVLVRHAEATLDGKRELTSAGLKRAAELGQRLKHAGITAIFTSDTARTQQTAAPVAAQLNVKPRVFGLPTKKQIVERAQHHKDVVSAVRANAPGGVLIVGHETTIPAFIKGLGGPEVPNVCPTAHDGLFVLVVSANTRLILGRYGDITECRAETAR